MTALMISNKEMEDIMKIVRCLRNSGLLINGVIEAIQNEAKELKNKSLAMLLGTLAASLFGKMLIAKGVIRAGEGTNRVSGFFMLSYPFTIFEMKEYRNEANFNGVYSRNSLPQMKDETYVINLEDYKSIGTH